MFYCDSCRNISNIGEPCNKVVVSSRSKNYKNKILVVQKGKKKYITKESEGWEIEKEAKLCKECYIKLGEE